MVRATLKLSLFFFLHFCTHADTFLHYSTGNDYLDRHITFHFNKGHLVMKSWAVFIKTKEIRSERTVVFGSENMTFQLWESPKKNLYTELSKKDLEAIYDKKLAIIKKKRESVKSLKGKVSAEYYRKLEESFQLPKEPTYDTFTVEELAKNQPVEKWITTKVKISKGSKHRTKLWFAPLKEVGINQDDRNIFNSLTSYQNTYDKATNGVGTPLSLFPGVSMWSRIEGFPVKLQLDGGPYILRKVESKPLLSSDYMPPEEMKKNVGNENMISI